MKSKSYGQSSESSAMFANSTTENNTLILINLPDLKCLKRFPIVHRKVLICNNMKQMLDQNIPK